MGGVLQKGLLLLLMSSCVFAGESQFRSSSVLGLLGRGQWLGFSQKKDHVQTSWQKAVDSEDQVGEAYGLGWNFDLGYSFLWEASVPRFISWQGGFQIDVLPHWITDVQIQYDKMSYASYLHGGAQIVLGYIWFLGHVSQQTLTDPGPRAPASTYYSFEEEAKMEGFQRQFNLESEAFFEDDLSDEELSAQYPQMRLQYRFGFHLHQMPQGALNQYQSGPELEYVPRRDWSYRLAFHYFFYTPQNVASWWEGLGISSRMRLPSFPSQEISLISNQLFSFPLWQVDQATAWGVKNRDLAELKWTFSRQHAQAFPVVGGSFFYFREYFGHWGVGGGGGVMGFLDGSQINLTGQIVITYRY